MKAMTILYRPYPSRRRKFYRGWAPPLEPVGTEAEVEVEEPPPPPKPKPTSRIFQQFAAPKIGPYWRKGTILRWRESYYEVLDWKPGGSEAGYYLIRNLATPTGKPFWYEASDLKKYCSVAGFIPPEFKPRREKAKARARKRKPVTPPWAKEWRVKIKKAEKDLFGYPLKTAVKVDWLKGGPIWVDLKALKKAIRMGDPRREPYIEGNALIIPTPRGRIKLYNLWDEMGDERSEA